MLLTIIGWMTAVSLATAILYAIDKRAAKLRHRRVSENKLLIAAMLGGWPGGLLAGRMLRHKTSKSSYRIAFTIVSLVNLSLVIGLIIRLMI